MVSLTEIKASNAQISSSLSAGLIAVFAGATSGIGEMTLKEFAKNTQQPRIYFSGRSQEDGDRILAECKVLNSQGEYTFLKADLSLIRNVDDVCCDIKNKEKAINLLFLTMGTTTMHTETSEGLHFFVALPYYARARFILNLLPHIQQATDLRRVVSIGRATKEGVIDTNDLQARKMPILALRSHMSSIITVSLEAIAKYAPDVSFIHEYPGSVKTNLGLRDPQTWTTTIYRTILWFLGPFITIPAEESSAHHLYIATSARYPASSGGSSINGVPLEDNATVARGTDGRLGSGVYSIDWNGESASPKVEALLARYREDGTKDMVWNDIIRQFKRITGTEKI